MSLLIRAHQSEAPLPKWCWQCVLGKEERLCGPERRLLFLWFWIEISCWCALVFLPNIIARENHLVQSIKSTPLCRRVPWWTSPDFCHCQFRNLIEDSSGSFPRRERHGESRPRFRSTGSLVLNSQSSNALAHLRSWGLHQDSWRDLNLTNFPSVLLNRWKPFRHLLLVCFAFNRSNGFSWDLGLRLSQGNDNPWRFRCQIEIWIHFLRSKSLEGFFWVGNELIHLILLFKSWWLLLNRV